MTAKDVILARKLGGGGGGGTEITDGIVVKARDADGYATEVDVYFDKINMGIFGLEFSARSSIKYLIGYKVERINFKRDIVSIGRGGFRYCNALSGQIEQCFESVKEIAQEALANSSIESAHFPLAYKSDGGIFESCSNLKSINMPILESGVDPYFAKNSSALVDVYLPRIKVVNNGSFAGCTSLKNIQIGSVGYGLSARHSGTFSGCTQTGLVITTYCKGANADVTLADFRNGATNATIIIKASEDTTYNDVAYAAGETMITSTVEEATT